MIKHLSTYAAAIALAIAMPAIAASKKIDGPAPDFVLKTDSGENLRLEEQRGDVILLNFWASWCGPCRQEMPILEELHQRYERAGFKVLGINVEQDLEAAKRYLSKVDVSFPILYDPTSIAGEAYNVDAMPTTIMIDRDGNMRYLHRGFKPGYEDNYRAEIKELIRE